ncbi:MAG: hypothetical protein RBU21_22450 [FCB group bacterium]|nr:hypothetical protein [FCB group bacterium]
MEFAFGASWEVLKYDEPGGFYKTLLLKKVGATKAVDFLCLRDADPLLLVEVKDFSRGVPGKEKYDVLPVTVTRKVRDTIAGVVGGRHTAGPHGRPLFTHALGKLSNPPRVVYFFEDLATPARRSRERTDNKRDVLLKKLKGHLRWLTSDIMVVGLDNYRLFIRDLTVRRV